MLMDAFDVLMRSCCCFQGSDETLKHGFHVVSWRPAELMHLAAGQTEPGHRRIAHAFLQLDDRLYVGIESLAEELRHIDDGNVG